MSADLSPIRRIVTADDAHGRSRIAEDGAAAAVRTVAGRPGFRSVNVWRTEAAPAPIGAADSIARHQGILPPKNGGSILRIIDFPPEAADPAERQRQIAATFGDMFSDAQHDKRAGAHPGTHEIGFDSAADTITMRHTARSREGFARGALKAATWIKGKQGVHAFADVLFGKA